MIMEIYKEMRMDYLRSQIEGCKNMIDESDDEIEILEYSLMRKRLREELNNLKH